MKIILLLAGIFLFSTAWAQETHAPKQGTQPAKHKSSKKKKANKYPTHYGTASFYADKFEGRETANGEVFSQQKLSAACNIIPMNNWVRVTNTKNKKVVVLRINDRMHPKNPRLIDLSRAAAKKLHYTGNGIVKVKVEVLGKHLPEGMVGCCQQ